MILHRTAFIIGTLAAVMLNLLAGCRGYTPPVDYYHLSASLPSTEAMPSPQKKEGFSIGLGPVSMPDYLDRPQIVTRLSDNQIKVDEFHRWAGSINGNFVSVLAADVDLQAKTSQVLVHPWTARLEPDFSVSLVIHRFEGRLGESVQLTAAWCVTHRRQTRTSLFKWSIIEIATPKADYDGLVAAESQAIEQLSREIVQAIEGWSASTGP
jgi:uncharacterized lipoprotein YmbA